mmetsp:Transcript_12311/g.8957  ORF Transcript_12311/g.8957 Transcript_12311/m.8957 type:complete len:158 (+) Transcript_12311:318-791(+)
MDVFKLFDRENRGSISLGDLREAFETIVREPLPTIKDDIYLIFKRYDRDQDGKISFAEFTNLLVPRKNNELMFQANQPHQNNAQKTGMMLDIMEKLLKTHVNLEQAHEYIRQRLRSKVRQENIALNDLFKVADQDQKGYLSCYDLEKVLTECNKKGN